MRVIEIIERLNLKLLSGDKGINSEATGAYVSDLLSDVIGNAGSGCIWITVQTHLNVVAVASLKEIAAVIIVRDHIPDDDAMERSNIENIPLLSTDMDAFTTAGKLYNLLKKE